MRKFAVVCGVLTLATLGYAQTKPAPKTGAIKSIAKSATVPAALKMAYALNKGDVFRYRVMGLFHGHFPPFAQPDGPPINLRIVIEYTGKVNKADDKGAEVSFTVDKGDLYLLEKEPGADGKVAPADEVLFPIAMSTIEKTLNVTATMRPDGSVASVTTADAAPVKIGLGIDLRKLFLLMMPVTFADKPVKVNDEWAFKDGLLGQGEGKITYNGKLEALKAMGNGIASNVAVSAASKIDEKKTKDGKLTDKAAEAVESSAGTATIKGTMVFVAQQKNNLYAGRLKEGKLMLTANIATTAPNPEKPEEKLTTPSDVTARLTVQEIPIKKAAKTAAVPKENAHK